MIDKSLLGKQVKVTLSKDVIAKGKLLSYSDMGEFTIEDDCGDVHYCWPMLDIELDD